jgi:hypothetical protein
MSDIEDLIQQLRTRNGRPDGFGLGLTCDEAADALEAMRKDAARLREDYEKACKLVVDMHAAAVGEYTTPKKGVVEDVAEVRKDGARYRWLRNRVPGDTYRVIGVVYSEGGNGVDVAIDAAMAKDAT